MARTHGFDKSRSSLPRRAIRRPISLFFPILFFVLWCVIVVLLVEKNTTSLSTSLSNLLILRVPCIIGFMTAHVIGVRSRHDEAASLHVNKGVGWRRDVQLVENQRSLLIRVFDDRLIERVIVIDHALLVNHTEVRERLGVVCLWPRTRQRIARSEEGSHCMRFCRLFHCHILRLHSAVLVNERTLQRWQGTDVQVFQHGVVHWLDNATRDQRAIWSWICIRLVDRGDVVYIEISGQTIHSLLTLESIFWLQLDHQHLKAMYRRRSNFFVCVTIYFRYWRWMFGHGHWATFDQNSTHRVLYFIEGIDYIS